MQIMVLLVFFDCNNCDFLIDICDGQSPKTNKFCPSVPMHVPRLRPELCRHRGVWCQLFRPKPPLQRKGPSPPPSQSRCLPAAGCGGNCRTGWKCFASLPTASPGVSPSLLGRRLPPLPPAPPPASRPRPRHLSQVEAPPPAPNRPTDRNPAVQTAHDPVAAPPHRTRTS